MTRTVKPLSLEPDETEALRAIGWQRTGASSCPDSSLLLAAEEGMLDEATTARVRTHVAGCATCRLLLEDLASVLTDEPVGLAEARIRARISAGTPGHRGVPLGWVIAAGLALAAGLVLFIVIPRSSAPVPAPESQVARVVPTAVPSVFTVDRPSIPAGDIDLTVRGESATHVTLEERIAAALDKSDRGGVDAAMLDLRSLVKAHPASRIAALALGAVQLRAGQNSEAVTTLEQARSLKGEPATADEAGWFLGIALVRTGDASRARSILDTVCKHPGPRSATACAGVAEIDRRQPGK